MDGGSDQSDVQVKRETWKSKVDGVITLMAYSVGEGTLLKFPYLCARNGGGAFLVPFLMFSGLCALPLYFLEAVIGQYYQKGPVEVWNFCPAMKGLGLGTALISWTFAMYTPMYFSWYLYYMCHSFYSVLPWSSCGNSWNTPNCIETTSSGVNVSMENQTFDHIHASENMTPAFNAVSSSEEFWRYNALEISGGLEEMGGVRWPILGCLAFSFLLMYTLLFKGIRISGKVVYLTFICPIVLITIFLIRACFLPGATDGLLYILRPDFTKLRSPKIWIEACGYALHGMGTTTGITNTITSHNERSNNSFRVSVLLCVLDPLITIYCGLCVFTVLGHMAHVEGVTLDHFQSSGFNLAFMVLPEAVTYLPLPQLWSVFLFVMMMTLGLDSTMPSYEVAIETIGDQFPRLARRRWLLVAIVFIPSFILAIPYTTQGGIYLLTLVDWYAIVPPILIFGVVECLVLAWVFGTDRLSKLTQEMYNQSTPFIMKILIRFVTPALLLAIFIYAFYEYRPPKYGNYYFPGWATAIGWLISTAIILPTPCWAAYSVWRAEGNTFMQKLTRAFSSAENGSDVRGRRAEQVALSEETSKDNI